MGIREKVKESITNWSRFQFILKVFARHGFSSLVKELGIPFSAGSTSDGEPPLSPAQNLRLAFEELGPTFIKLGQILSTRPDLLPPAYIEEFSKLTDRIPAFSFAEVEKILHQQFGGHFHELFESIEESPIAAASISQVHRARLREGSRGVVIKIQRPGIIEDIESDIQILYFLSRGLEKVNEDLRLFNLSGIIEEFQKSIYEELDFSLEAKNLEAFAKQIDADSSVIVPHVIWEASSQKVLTMTEIEGTTLSQLKDWPSSIDREALADSLAQFFLEGMFFHGLFHCDAHAGNLILVTKDQGRIGLVDFGMVGRMGPELRDKMSKLFISLVSQDFENLALNYAGIAEVGKEFSLRDFKTSLEKLFAPNLSKPLGEVDVGQMMMDSIEIARRNQIKPPRDLILFYRSLVTLEAAGRLIDPQFDFIKFGTRFSKILIQRRFSSDNLKKDLFRALEGLFILGTEIPTQLKGLLYRIETDSLFPQLSRLEEGVKEFKRSHQILSLAIALFGMLLSSSILSQNPSYEVLPLILWTLTGVLGIFFLIRLLRR